MLTQANYRKPKIKNSIIEFKGYNANPVISSGEFSDMLNLSSNQYPCISPRPSREVVNNSITTGNALFVANNKICYVDGTSFYYDGVSKGTVTSSSKSMVEFNGKILVFPDKKYYDFVNNVFGTLGSGTYPASGSVPDIDFACVHANRVFGVKGNNIYACALGNASDWTTFAGLNTDAYATDTASEGNFINIIAFQGHVVLFKKAYIYELYGSNPANFSVKEISKKGCISGKSIVEVNSTLFFLAYDGINIYGGGLPVQISLPLNEKAIVGIAGTDNRKYYISLYNGVSYKLFVYDTLHRVWHKEDTLQVVEFATLDNHLYALAIDVDYTNTHDFYAGYTHTQLASYTHNQLKSPGIGVTKHRLYKFDSGSETINWEAITETFTEYVEDKKGYSKISTRIDLTAGSTLAIYIKEDNNDFRLIGNYNSANMQSVKAYIIPNRVDHFQIKFVGTGNIKVYSLQREFFVSSDK